MRKIDYDKPFSDEDIAWLRQAGFMSEERIAAHQGRFDAEVPDPEIEDDELSKSALDPTARVAQRAEGVGDGHPTLVDPTGGDVEDEGDDYDSWKVNELENEVTARNVIASEREDVTEVEVTGTGANGKITKPDLIKGLRLWDEAHPGVLSE